MQSLADILRAKDARAERQARLLAQYQKPVLSFKLNIPGAVKNNPLLKRIFDAGIEALRRELDQSGIALLFEAVADKQSGPEFFAVFDAAAAVIKQITWRIEESHPLAGCTIMMSSIKTAASLAGRRCGSRSANASSANGRHLLARAHERTA